MVLLAAGMLVAACGDDDSSDSTTDPTAANSNGGAPDESDLTAVDSLPDEGELSAGLLTIGDMPTGWAVIPDDGEDDDPLCDFRIEDLLDLDDELPSAEVTFAEDANTGPLVTHIVGFAPEGRGEEAITAVRDAINDCEGDDFDDFTATISELSFPTVGDESLAYRIRLENDDIGFDVDLVYARTDDLIVVVVAIEVFGNPTTLLEEYAPLAVERSASELLPR